ncbi:IclR family transcriptional regulator [Kaistia algarum]|uniref:IclR family transcriptional regulator n=1 Tax=Kaistia algarum TaxID=2083279 RepID=UPI000CE73CF3|nr:IclR family transcriptional regulator [Kaistia algarum]MCX5514347.1 IclR family transcriptional regulator [Kaistia algarum]PPE79097.1 IclR family transcriptional regulator [Kaistia algarum]
MSVAEGDFAIEGEDTDAAGEARRDYKVPAAEKALDILEYMAARNEDLTQTEISAGLGRSIHEIYRVIQLLEGRGYLIRTRADRYRLSLKLFELAHMHPPVNRLVDAALPVLRGLVGGTDQSCHLVVLRGSTVLVVLQVDSPLPMRYSVALGSHFPVLETSSGAVLLSALPPAEREALVSEVLASGEAGAGREEIAARLGEIERLGHEMRASLAVEGCTNISVPIRDHIGATVAALTVPYLPQKQARFDKASVLASARAAANEISRALGAPEAAGRNRAVRAESS